MAAHIRNRPDCDLLRKVNLLSVSHLRHRPYCPLCCHGELGVEAKEDGRAHGDPVHDGHRGDSLGQLLQQILRPFVDLTLPAGGSHSLPVEVYQVNPVRNIYRSRSLPPLNDPVTLQIGFQWKTRFVVLKPILMQRCNQLSTSGI